MHKRLFVPQLLFIVAMGLMGCSDDPNIPRVSYSNRYEEPPVNGAYRVPALRAGDPLLEFHFDEPARSGWRLSFEGTITAERDEVHPEARLPHAIHVLIVGRADDETIDYFNSSAADLGFGKQERAPDGSLLNKWVYEDVGTRPFKVALQGPATPGSYTVMVVAHGGNYDAEPIAKGLLTVNRTAD
uniref:Uncharacterized protein n=1 Tax=Schlesneria paludicola TaxID=360056 RepID=A0A7C2K0C2_9PLAN